MMEEKSLEKYAVTENQSSAAPRKVSFEISSLPSGIKSHFQLVREPNAKGQARYRCWTCSHEFECSGRNRLIHHVTGVCLDGSPSIHIVKCPYPHQPLKNALIAKIFQDLPAREVRESMRAKRKKEPEVEELAALKTKHQKITDPAMSPNQLQFYPPDRTMEILNLLQIICPQYVQLAITIENLQRTSADAPSIQALSSSLALALGNSNTLGSGGIANGIGLLPYLQFKIPDPFQQQPPPKNDLNFSSSSTFKQV